jgi:nucleotide-binding universal stress UspA family protein
MKKILIALDYDPTAQKIAESGYELAIALKAEVVLLHVLLEPIYYSSTAYAPIMGFGGYVDMDFMQPEISNELKKWSLNFLEKTKHHLGGSNISTFIKTGEAADVILEIAEAEKADIIVMGSLSKRWLEEMLVGSVTKKVLNHSTIHYSNKKTEITV